MIFEGAGFHLVAATGAFEMTSDQGEAANRADINTVAEPVIASLEPESRSADFDVGGWSLTGQDGKFIVVKEGVAQGQIPPPRGGFRRHWYLGPLHQ